jgi:ketosteroid isomerase-like protein
VSEENVERARKVYAQVRFDRADATSFERAISAFFQVLDADAEWQPDENDTDPELLRGHAQIRDFFERHAEPWQEFRWEPSELHDAGDEVVALGEIYARGREAGIEVRAPYAHRFTFRDDHLVRGQEYLTDPRRALKDAGLSE